jgi:hypothetical protein
MSSRQREGVKLLIIVIAAMAWTVVMSLLPS